MRRTPSKAQITIDCDDDSLTDELSFGTLDKSPKAENPAHQKMFKIDLGMMHYRQNSLLQPNPVNHLVRFDTNHKEKSQDKFSKPDRRCKTEAHYYMDSSDSMETSLIEEEDDVSYDRDPNL